MAAVFLFCQAPAGAGVGLTPDEQAWLRQHSDKLVLWFNTDFPPIEFADKTSRFTGLGADVIALVEKQLGIVFQKHASHDWTEHLKALAGGECAVAPTIVETVDRKRYAAFTRPYASSPVVIITANTVHNDLEVSDLEGLRVAVVSGYATQGYLVEQATDRFEIVPMPDVLHALRATSFGQVDAYVENLAVAAYYIHREGIPNLRVAGDTPYSFAWRIGVSRQYPLLASAMDKALAAISAKDLEGAHARWLSLKIDAGWPPGMVRRLVWAAIFAVVMVLGLLAISYVLKQRLKEKIASLESARLKISEQTEFLQLATEVTQAGFWDARPPDRTIFFSRQWFGLLGYDQDGETLSYDRIKTFIHPDDFSTIRKVFKDYLQSDGQLFYEVELRLKQADGRWCWILSKGRAGGWDENGAVTRIIGLDVNIQTIKDAQEDVRQKEAKFRTVFDNAPYSIVINDLASGRIMDANQAFLKKSGIEHPDMLTQLPGAGFATMKAHEAQPLLDRLMATGKISNYETQDVRKDGSLRHLVYSCALMESAGRSQILSIIIDNTGQKKVENALKQSEARFRQLFMSAPVPLMLLSGDGTISAINDAMVRTFGYTLEDIPDIDRWWSLAYRDPRYRQRVKRAWQEDVGHAFADNGRVKVREYYVTCKDTKVLRVRFNTSVFEDMIIVSLHEITALREKEAALQETMERLRATLDATKDGILVINNNMQVIQANRQFYKMWRIPSDMPDIDDDLALGRYVKGQLEDPEGFTEQVNRLYSHRRHEIFEVRFKDGRVFDIFSAPMVMAGEETGRVWDFRDITEQKKAEQAIDLERKKLKSIFGAMNDVVLICDARGRILEVAPTNDKSVCRSTDDILGNTLNEVFPTVKSDIFMAAIRQAISRNESVAQDYELTIEGQSVWMAANISPMPPDRAVWVARNITSRKHSEAQLQQSEEKFSKIFAMAPSIVTISRLEDGHIMDVNKGFEEITGWKKSEVVGRTSADLEFWAEPGTRSEMIKELAAGRDLFHQEINFRRKDKKVRMGLYSARSISLAGELCILSVIQDITEIKKIQADRQKLQNQLAQAQKMEAIGVLAGGIAHDFNNILSALMGFTDLAKMEAGENQTLKKYLNSVSSAGLRARDLVGHILTFSRKSDVKLQAMSIVPIIKETLKFMRASLPANILINQDIRVKKARVTGDATQVHQILMNLFTNAGHAMKDRGGTLDVVLDTIVLDQTDISHFGNIRPGHYFALIVSDTGCGIPAEAKDRIFEPFFTTKTREEGTGMGLSTVYGIVRDMKGGISVYSEPDKGTTFKILLPGQQTGQTTQTESLDLKPGRGKLLIVDDEEPITVSSQKILTSLGYTVTATTSSLQALEAIRKDPLFFDLVLTDMNMPHMNGLELSRNISAINPGIPIILCTGFGQELTAQIYQAAGVSELVMKPMIASELSMTVFKTLEKNRSDS